MDDMLIFVNEMKPESVSELVYSEFVMNTIQAECVIIKTEFNDGKIVLPESTKLSVTTREEACRRVFGDRALLAQKYTETLKMVRENGMVGVTQLDKGLSDDDLIDAIRRNEVKFASEPSAVYHSKKHPTDPPHEYVKKANATINNGSWRVTLAQDGQARLISVDDGHWKAFLVESGGPVDVPLEKGNIYVIAKEGNTLFDDESKTFPFDMFINNIFTGNGNHLKDLANLSESSGRADCE
ncbi:hypothetical protein KGM_209394 [Danaus plexippus plexippus]|uniref:Uncharacterized protein n=1 Tax=Danaus plexippus plexippus TaxID=278856 RepID=A0A212ET72_DANPL|nr:hypothetical protein KGM_209394 [Danaus plexippus plexippus]